MVQDSRVPHKFKDWTGRHEITLLGTIYTPQIDTQKAEGLNLERAECETLTNTALSD